MAFSQAQLDAIENAIASGVTTVSYEGKNTSFRTLDEMLRVRDIIRRALGIAPQTSATVLVAHDRGFPAASSWGDNGQRTGW